MSEAKQAPAGATYRVHHPPFTYDVHELSEGYSAIIYDADGRCVGTGKRFDHMYEADAAFIVRAVNAHDQLVALVTRAQAILADYLEPGGLGKDEALDALLSLLDGPQSRAALAAAGAIPEYQVADDALAKIAAMEDDGRSEF